MKILKRNILFFGISLLFFCTSSVADKSKPVNDYQAVFIPMYNLKGELRIAIRSYFSDNELHYLLVDPKTFLTETDRAIKFRSRKLSQSKTPEYFTARELEDTPYLIALRKYSSPAYILQNYGLTQAEHNVDGMFLSVDLCPSVKKFETNFFDKLVMQSNKKEQPFPIAIAISGLWLSNHPREFSWLVDQKNKNELNITWLNHSFSHPYYKDRPLENNFLLTPGTMVKNEVLMTEKLLLKRNEIPSVFFRFPGLVSDEKTVKELNELGLIPVGSNAWLAKGEKAKLGSIVLIHGNGNEPKGIEEASKLIKNDIRWLPLNKAL